MSRIELPDVTKYVEDGQPVLFGDEHFMRAALRCAENAAAAGEVPVGAVAVKDGIIIAKAWNQVELLKDATAHAEVLLISSISAALNDWRMEDVDIYVTKEPCAMCAGAIVNARISRVVFGVPDLRFGAFGSLFDLSALPTNHKPLVEGGLLREECLSILRAYFKEKRKN